MLHLTTNGNAWTAENNWNATSKDKYCSWTGITCNAQKQVTSINLNGFGLTGTIPEEMGGLLQLIHLDLSHNKLAGYIPSDLRFAPINVLDLTNNLLEGVVPPLLCRSDANHNGKAGNYQCDNIICGAETYNSKGFATEEEPCRPCFSYISSASPFLGQTNCGIFSSGNNLGPPVVGAAATGTPAQKTGIVIAIMLSVWAFVLFCMYVYQKSKSRVLNSIEADNLWWSNQYSQPGADTITEGGRGTSDEEGGQGQDRHARSANHPSSSTPVHSNRSNSVGASRFSMDLSQTSSGPFVPGQQVQSSNDSFKGDVGAKSASSGSTGSTYDSHHSREHNSNKCSQSFNVEIKQLRKPADQNGEKNQEPGDVWLDVPRIN
jgi:hypothetical protein